MKVCDMVITLRDVLEKALKKDDIELREYLGGFVNDINKAIGIIICTKDDDNDDLEIEIKKKKLYY